MGRVIERSFERTQERTQEQQPGVEPIQICYSSRKHMAKFLCGFKTLYI